MTNRTPEGGEHFLDITSDICPITFVKTKLALEKMKPGEVMCVRLREGEPLENVPRSVVEEGHRVLGIEPEAGGVHRIRIRKRD